VEFRLGRGHERIPAPDPAELGENAREKGDFRRNLAFEDSMAPSRAFIHTILARDVNKNRREKRSQDLARAF
jgi:hypothetical protein